METLGNLPPSGVNDSSSQFRMIDVGEKVPTRRRAIASGKIKMASSTIEKIARKEMPKGDVLALAEVAGIMGAKRVSELLPLCHPLSLDAVRVRCEVITPQNVIYVQCEAITFAKTGVEMEALAGVSAALLSIYDLTKGIDPVLTISDILLERKEGGKSGIWVNPSLSAQSNPASDIAKLLWKGLRCAVVTVSDRCSQGKAADVSGPILCDMIEKRGAEVVATKIVSDDELQIQAAVRHLAFEDRVDLILTTGGTGLGPRDITPEAVSELFTKQIPGFGERLRLSGSQKTEKSWLSRSNAGLIEKTLVILLPGSPKAVKEGIEALEDLIPHALEIAKGGGH